MNYITPLHLMPNIGQIDPFSLPYKSFHFIWTQVILQTTGIVFPYQPTFAVSMDGNFHGLETILWPFRVYEHATPT